ncbi:hypothetical protein CFK37_02155 [Virgibacillus phasianinus]|uniref:YtxH domain-containing protein n=1 Tax=Virgibacillus phasianinus TaxID=2017483 RepID=A0A220TZM2_9BACI|nr:hypothetical protein [Virgibacillus phasianinus]ASK61083.1 hypothetical protein CFK37_02155 [Virgibacillus phasianinus]
MRNNKLLFGMMIGGLIGGLVTLFDRETRSRTKVQFLNAKRKTNYYVKNPSEAVSTARIACNKFNESFNSSADNAINALEQVEQTIEKITSKNEQPKRLESVE